MRKWLTTGSLLRPEHTPARPELVKSGAWAIGGGADHLHDRLATTLSLLQSGTAEMPVVAFVHCNAGRDRTGEFATSYYMTHLGLNVTAAYARGCREGGRCPNYYSTSAVGWWCLSLQQLYNQSGLGDCLGFADCKFAGDCHPTNGSSAAASAAGEV